MKSCDATFEQFYSNVSPELLVGGSEVLVDGVQVCVVSQEHLIGCSVLQHLGHRAQVSALLGGQLTASRHLDDVEGVRRHNGRVHVAVIQKVPHNLKNRTATNPLLQTMLNTSGTIFCFICMKMIKDIAARINFLVILHNLKLAVAVR